MGRFIVSAAASLLLASPTLAADLFTGHVVLVLSGSSYEGPPTFVVSVDGEQIGEGEVSSAFDSEEEGSVTPELVAQHAQRFAFSVPYGETPSQIELAFTNDNWGGPSQPSLGRDLYILSVTYNESDLPLEAFTTSPPVSELIDGAVVLRENATVSAPLSSSSPEE